MLHTINLSIINIRNLPAMDEAPAPKRQRRAAAASALSALTGAETTIAEVAGISLSQSIALTDSATLDKGDSEALCRRTPPASTAIVTLHTNERPRRLPKACIHIGAAFDDTATFDDDALTAHLRLTAAFIWSASAQRVVFVCNAGINRSSLALCFYSASYGCANFQQVKSALIDAKGGAARGWPTLQNVAFEAYLKRHFGSSSSVSNPGSAVSLAKAPRWFWRTVATARASTGGKGADPELARQAQIEREAEQRNVGIDPKTGRTWGCWANGRPGGTWVRGVPGKPRPWQSKDGAPLGQGT